MSLITSVQGYKKAEFSSSAAPSATFLSAPPEGSVIFAFIALNEHDGDVDPTITGFTDIVNSNKTGFCRIKAFYKIAGPSESPTVTGTLSVARPCAISIHNYTNIDVSDPIDVVASNIGTSAAPNSGLATTDNVVAEHFFGAFCSTGAEAASSPDNSYTEIFAKAKNTGQSNTSFGYEVCERDVGGANNRQIGVNVDLTNIREWAGLAFSVKQIPPTIYTKTASIVSGAAVLGALVQKPSKSAMFKFNSTTLRALRGPDTFSRTSKMVSSGLKLGAERPHHPVRSALFVAGTKLLTGTERLLHGASLVRDITKHVFGGASAHITTAGIAANEGVMYLFTPSITGPHVVSVYLESTDIMRLRVANAAGPGVAASGPIPPTNTFQRVKLILPGNLVAGTTYKFFIETNGVYSTEFWIDGAQAELNPDASPYVEGSRPAGQGSVGEALRAQKPAALVMEYIVSLGGPGSFVTYQELYDHHIDYEDVMDTEQTYQDVYTHP